ncbi:MAG: insulinase family protein [Acidobacteria bacterium]|nr:insulinase family protein [Acidobacteriota bacterium]
MLKIKPLLSSVQRPVEKFWLGTLTARSTCRAAVLFGWLGLLGTLVPVVPANSFQASQDNAAESPPPRIVGPFLSREDVGPFTRVVFKNGLTVLLFERSNTPLVAMVTYVKAGRIHQDASSQGFWDLWTPLLFHSPPPGGEGTVAGEARRIGAVLDTGVGEDHAWFSTVLPREAYRRGLDLQVTAVDKWNPSTERVRKLGSSSPQRRRFRQGPPEREYGRQLFDLALRRGSGLDEGSGSPGSPQGIDFTQFSSFHSRWFVPGNVLLAITGDFDRRALLREIVKRYRSLPKGPTLDPPAVPTPHTGGFSYAYRRQDLHQAGILIGFPLPSAFSREWYACKVLQAVLTAGRTSVLNRRLDMVRSPVHGGDSNTVVPGQTRYLILSLGAGRLGLDRSAVTALAAIERIKQGVLAESDLQRARALLAVEFLQSQEGLLGLAIQIARHEHQADFRKWEETLQRIESVTLEEVVGAARRYLDLERCTLLEYQPASEEIRQFNSGSYLEFLRMALPRAVGELKGDDWIEVPLPEEKGQSEGRPPSRRGPGEISTAGLVPPLRKFSILRGPDVWVQEGRWLRLASMGIFFPGGQASEPADKQGITGLMAATAIGAGASPQPTHPAALMERMGVEVDAVVEPDYFGFVLHGLSDHFAACVDILAETLQRPTFEEEVVAAQKQTLRLRAARQLDDPRSQVERLFLRAAYGTHPYGRDPYGERTALGTLNRQDLLGWHRRYVQGTQPVVVIAGDVEGSAFAARFAGKWRRSGISRIEYEDIGDLQRLAGSRVLEGRAGKGHPWLAQAGFPGPRASEPRMAVFAVLQHLTSGAGGSLSLALKKRKGLASGVLTSLRRLKWGGYFFARLTAAPADGNRALEALRAQLTGLGEGMLSEESIDEARRAATRSYRIASQHRRRHVLELAERAIFGQSVHDVTNTLKQIQGVKSREVAAVAQEFFRPELFIAGVVSGPEP